jgi:alkylation response protein AidB-like acyl-CoA dehydrogenase
VTDLETYRAKARGWLETQAPRFGAAARKGLSEPDDLALGRQWQTAKFDAGYAGIAWKPEHGGQGLTALEKLAFEQEEIKHGFPNDFFGVSLGMPVPIMLRYLPDGWKQERARAALRGEEIWCQLFSEPAAGSDLAGLRTRAVRDEASGDWIVNGQKLWTSWAQYSDYGVIVVRTDPTAPKHKGLTYFWIDMKAPGVTVRPVKLAAGGSHVNEVFFDDVRLPDAQRLGPVGGGFGVAMETLVIERYSATDPAGFGPPLVLLIEAARVAKTRGRPAIEDGRVRERIARTYAVQNGMASIYKKTLLSLAAGLQPGPEGALHKLVSVRARQKLSEFAIDLQGVSGVRYDGDASPKADWAVSWMTAPTGRIAGGADEMLLNTIAEKILGLPQDHRQDKGVPFNEIPR